MMRWCMVVVAALGVIGLAFWAYSENYATRAAVERHRALQKQIGAARERLALLRAEWAYLNRPDRLRELVLINFDRLELLPLDARQFGRVDEIAWPPVGRPLALDDPVALAATGVSSR